MAGALTGDVIDGVVGLIPDEWLTGQVCRRATR